MSTSIADFQRAATAHLNVARSCDHAAATAPHASPSSVAYLSCVAAECCLKSLILKSARVADTDKLKTSQPKIHKALFSGKEGHDLTALAQQADIARRLGQDAPRQHDPAWRRMCHGDRPYSLRYATEHLSSEQADEEVAITEKLLLDIKNVLGRAAK
jgi:hypothetical protein